MNLNEPVPSHKDEIPPKPKGYRERVEWEAKYGKPMGVPARIITWTFTILVAGLAVLCAAALGVKLVAMIMESF